MEASVDSSLFLVEKPHGAGCFLAFSSCLAGGDEPYLSGNVLCLTGDGLRLAGDASRLFGGSGPMASGLYPHVLAGGDLGLRGVLSPDSVVGDLGTFLFCHCRRRSYPAWILRFSSRSVSDTQAM